MHEENSQPQEASEQDARSWFAVGGRTCPGCPALQAGNAVNFFGYGLILPFEIIYLHQVRGFPTATAGLVLAAILGTAALVTPPSGALLDHFRAKPILIPAISRAHSAMPALRSSTGRGRRSLARSSAVPGWARPAPRTRCCASPW